ncbi:NUCLEAR PORE COMPLEX PROTEIN (NUCLEOPORIN NUP116) [Encephalitozoon cuniculi GB-M1]|uniref:NUCLEAR PORE COMPLEX PROTEIN (NUCLEOPORIN NUP116) n=1 Tax=Encephalitozoon cuniculi (strain GB-M1) TaxID=284813 RepID=Q8SQR9_ENCCU|nr:uncharacterized protein ECU11_1820 [Encephalitozoon cuniculi GB-M1]CAD26092.1 NUCLEAR PORE COMPLEX PROTEIN (NUCLEOPORIN NUP116) [Encephalitozoon cuniculi GB-M1]
MNSNFFNQQNKDDNTPKNPFLNTPFGSQQNTFGSQMNKPSIFGNQPQQTGVFGAQQAGGVFNPTPSAGFGGSGQSFSTQGFQSKQDPGTVFGSQKPQAQTTPLFGKPGDFQPAGSSSIFGTQNASQVSTNPFKPQAAIPSSSGGFGTQQSNSTFGTQFQPPAGNAFGAQAASQPANLFSSTMQSSSPIGIPSTQNLGSIGSLGTTQASGFGAPQSQIGAQGPGIQGQQAGPGNQQASNLFGNTSSVTVPTAETQNVSSSFASTPGAQLKGDGTFSSSAPLSGSQSLPQASEPKDASPSGRKPRISASVFNHPVGEKSVSFIQMTLGEIIQQQARKLEENIKVFKEKAREVFEQDERIIRSLNNYKLIRNRIEEEERVIAETEENVEFFERWLCNFQEEVPPSAGDELLTCIKEFERVCDKYNKTIETLKDEEDEVMCLVNENYNLITTIEEKLEILEKY